MQIRDGLSGFLTKLLLFAVISAGAIVMGGWWATIPVSVIFAIWSGWPVRRLGFELSPGRVGQFVSGVSLGSAMVLVFAGLVAIYRPFHWERNVAVTGALVGWGIWFYLKSAVVEELLFRGYGFQLLIDRVGFRWAQGVVAIAFAAYHVANVGMPPLAALLFTAPGSLLFGYAYLKSRGVVLPIAIHGAWNFWQEQLVGSSGRGQQGFWTLVTQSHGRPPFWVSYGASMAVLVMGAVVIRFAYGKKADYS